jgi:hypothetical protein
MDVDVDVDVDVLVDVDVDVLVDVDVDILVMGGRERVGWAVRTPLPSWRESQRKAADRQGNDGPTLGRALLRGSREPGCSHWNGRGATEGVGAESSHRAFFQDG